MRLQWPSVSEVKICEHTAWICRDDTAQYLDAATAIITCRDGWKCLSCRWRALWMLCMLSAVWFVHISTSGGASINIAPQPLSKSNVYRGAVLTLYKPKMRLNFSASLGITCAVIKLVVLGSFRVRPVCIVAQANVETQYTRLCKLTLCQINGETSHWSCITFIGSGITSTMSSKLYQRTSVRMGQKNLLGPTRCM